MDPPIFARAEFVADIDGSVFTIHIMRAAVSCQNTPRISRCDRDTIQPLPKTRDIRTVAPRVVVQHGDVAV
jgi:hypothetical protein